VALVAEAFGFDSMEFDYGGYLTLVPTICMFICGLLGMEGDVIADEYKQLVLNVDQQQSAWCPPSRKSRYQQSAASAPTSSQPLTHSNNNNNNNSNNNSNANNNNNYSVSTRRSTRKSSNMHVSYEDIKSDDEDADEPENTATERNRSQLQSPSQQHRESRDRNHTRKQRHQDRKYDDEALVSPPQPSSAIRSHIRSTVSNPVQQDARALNSLVSTGQINDDLFGKLATVIKQTLQASLPVASPPTSSPTQHTQPVLLHSSHTHTQGPSHSPGVERPRSDEDILARLSDVLGTELDAGGVAGNFNVPHTSAYQQPHNVLLPGPAAPARAVSSFPVCTDTVASTTNMSSLALATDIYQNASGRFYEYCSKLEWKQERNKHEAMAWARVIDGMIGTGRLRIHDSCMMNAILRFGGVQLADRHGNWLICDAITGVNANSCISMEKLKTIVKPITAFKQFTNITKPSYKNNDNPMASSIKNMMYETNNEIYLPLASSHPQQHYNNNHNNGSNNSGRGNRFNNNGRQNRAYQNDSSNSNNSNGSTPTSNGGGTDNNGAGTGARGASTNPN